MRYYAGALACFLGLVLWGGVASAQAPAPGVVLAQPAPADGTPVAPVAPAAMPLPGPAAAPVAATASSAPPITRPTLVANDSINGADTAWMLTSTALVLLMTLPGIALFYAGMVRRKSVINTMASVVAIAALVSLLWFAVGYSWAFTPGNGFVGNGSRLWFTGLDYLKESGKVMVSHVAPNVPESVYAMFQLTFAVITAALIVGSVVERMRFSAILVFISLWSLFVYAPVAHWVWEPGGWLAQLGALDFAGGSVVHINAGVSGLVCAYFLGPRRGYGREAFEPFNLGLTMAGAGMLWVGWFGFNAGSAVASDGRAGLAMAVTHIAASAGAVSWMGAEWLVRGRPSLLGLCSGLVAGLVAITPASGFVTPRDALLIGVLSGIACSGRHRLEARAGRRRLAGRVRRARGGRHRGLAAHRRAGQQGRLGCSRQLAGSGVGRARGVLLCCHCHCGFAGHHQGDRGLAGE